jgi:response regulator of citrate/malate metabolism
MAKHLTTSTAAGRAERVRWWIRNGIVPFDAKALRLAAAVGISRDEAIELATERLRELEAKQRAKQAEIDAYLNAKAGEQ